MVIDIVLVLVVAVLIIIGVMRGIARTLYNLLSVFLSALLAYFLGKAAAGWIFENFIASSIERSVTESLANASQSAGSVSQDVIDGLPDYISGMLGMFGISSDSISNSVSGAADASSEMISNAIVGAIAPTVTAIISVVLLIVLFIIFILIFKLLSRRFLKLFELPIIRSVNKLLGGALGMCEGVVLCYIFIFVCRIILPYSQEPFITPEMIESSVIFKTIYYSDFLNSVSGLITMGNDAVNNVKGIFGTDPATAATEATTALN